MLLPHSPDIDIDLAPSGIRIWPIPRMLRGVRRPRSLDLWLCACIGSVMASNKYVEGKTYNFCPWKFYISYHAQLLVAAISLKIDGIQQKRVPDHDNI